MFRETQASKTHVTAFKRSCRKIRHDKILAADLSGKTTAVASRDFTSESDPECRFGNMAVQ